MKLFIDNNIGANEQAHLLSSFIEHKHPELIPEFEVYFLSNMDTSRITHCPHCKQKIEDSDFEEDYCPYCEGFLLADIKS